MKGLLIKDFKLIMLQKKIFLLTLIIVMGILVFSNEIIFPLVYFSFIVTLFTLSTISYDDLNNGNAFLFTLPITRSNYVIEKYSLSLLFSGMAWVFTTILGIIITILKDTLPVADLVLVLLAIIPIMLVVQAIMIPFQLKFGGEQARVAMIVTYGVIAIIAFIIIKGLKLIFNIDLVSILYTLPTLSMGALIVIIAIVALLLLLISLKISLSIMNKKEF